jgi:hypothetical protein
MNNLFTLIWGKDFWATLHNVSFGYPNNPTNDDKIHYKNFYNTIQYVLPCCLCKNHYADLITNSIIKLDDKYFENTRTLSEWVYKLHEFVNNKLGVVSGITYEQLAEKYKSYITSNDLNKEERIKAFTNYYSTEPPFLSYEIACKFIKDGSYYYPDFEETINKYNNLSKSNKSDPDWIIRNNKCNKCIQRMRLYDVCGIKDGKITKYELYLIKHLSTSLSRDDLNNYIKVNNIKYS